MSKYTRMEKVGDLLARRSSRRAGDFVPLRGGHPSAIHRSGGKDVHVRRGMAA